MQCGSLMDKGVHSKVIQPPKGRLPEKYDLDLELTYEDIKSIFMLFVLYTIQGLPIGLHATMPLIIHDKVSYSQMAYLSCTGLPFCLKLLWAPILDSVYSRRFGKRKSWLLPVQMACGALLMYGGMNNRIDKWTGQQDTQVSILALTFYFSILYFLLATQDIVVDGWAITILRPELRIHASTCNTAGQAFGINIAFVGYTLLSSKRTCIGIQRIWSWVNNLIGGNMRSITEEDILVFKPYATLSDFTWAFGILIIFLTILVLFKDEEGEQPMIMELPNVTEIREFEKNTDANSTSAIINQSYSLLLEVGFSSFSLNKMKQILRLKPTKHLCRLLLTYGLFFAAESPTELKLLEKGMPKDLFASVTPLMIPLEIFGPPIITMIMHKSSTTDVLYKGMCVRLFSLVLYSVLVIMTGIYYSDESHDALAKASFYIFFVSVSLFRRVCCLIVNVSFMSLFAQVADPSIGGMYMALLNTLGSVGELVPRMLGLWLVDIFGHPKVSNNDGLYIEVGLCVVSGLLLFSRYHRILKRINSFETNEWYINKSFI